MAQAFGCSDLGLVRKNNEDSFLVDDALGLYVVADGMGGAVAGECASRIAVETVAEVVAHGPQRDLALLTSAVAEANRRVLAAARNDPALDGMGTTLVGVLAGPAECHVASVGDSRAYLFSAGRLAQLTTDQTWVNEVGRKLGLSEEALRTHNMRHVLTMAVGSDDKLRINSLSVQAPASSLLLLCSDGLHGPVSDGEIEKILAEEIQLGEKCHSLIEAAKQAGGPDNVTAVLVSF